MGAKWLRYLLKKCSLRIAAAAMENEKVSQEAGTFSSKSTLEAQPQKRRREESLRTATTCDIEFPGTRIINPIGMCGRNFQHEPKAK
jgi:hypothetical protein